MTIAGIDVSNYQGIVDWRAVAAAGYQFGIAKRSEGPVFVDATFPADWAGMAENNVVRASYHFARPHAGNPEPQAERYVNLMGELQTGDILAGDFEDDTQANDDQLGWTLAFLEEVERLAGVTPLLYSRTEFMVRHNLTDPRLGRFGLWLASYSPTPPVAPDPWGFWAVWQSGQGTVPGVAGAVDQDLFNGSRAQMLQYGLPAKPLLVATNDDLVACVRYLLAEPPDMAGLIAYAGRFV